MNNSEMCVATGRRCNAIAAIQAAAQENGRHIDLRGASHVCLASLEQLRSNPLSPEGSTQCGIMDLAVRESEGNQHATS